MEIDKFLPPKFSEAMKDLADLLLSQKQQFADQSEETSKMGLTSHKSQFENHKSLYDDSKTNMYVHDQSPEFYKVAKLPNAIVEQQSVLDSARKKISS